MAIMEIYPLAFKEHFILPIMDNKASKVVQFSFPKGKILDKHTTSSHILVLVVSGQVRFRADEEVLLQSGQLVSLEPNVEHSVEALEDSIMLLILTPSPSAHTIFKPSEAGRHTPGFEEKPSIEPNL
jgi:quercetin dioxygenase-like cupin family protein